MTNPGPARRPQPQPQPQPSGSGGGLGRAVLSAAVLAVVVVAVLAAMTRCGGGQADTSTPKTNVVAELKKAGFKKDKTEKRKSAEAGREVVTEHWVRGGKPPETVVISDDSPYTTAGVMIINNVSYNGSDGKGNLTCMPTPENARSPLGDVIADADKVREAVKAGTLQPDPQNNPRGLPYAGEIVGCMP